MDAAGHLEEMASAPGREARLDPTAWGREGTGRGTQGKPRPDVTASHEGASGSGL